MLDFLEHLRQQLTDAEDFNLIGQAEVLVASGYEDVLPEVQRILMRTSIAGDEGYAEDVGIAIAIAASSGPPPAQNSEANVMSAFRRDLLDRKKESVAETLKELKAGA